MPSSVRNKILKKEHKKHVLDDLVFESCVLFFACKYYQNSVWFVETWMCFQWFLKEAYIFSKWQNPRLNKYRAIYTKNEKFSGYASDPNHVAKVHGFPDIGW